MKAIILTDIEGVAGVVSFEDQAYAAGKHHEQAKLLATREVNAAVEVLVEAGVVDILVWDGHGPGGISYEVLHPAARLLHGRPLAPQAVRDRIVRGYDIGLLLGQHAMAGTEDGNLCHTQNSKTVESFTLNGRLIGESAQFALYLGAFDIPLVFLSGDAAACREAEALVPGITTASVKEGLSMYSAISVSPQLAHERIRTGVGLSLEKHRGDPVAPLVWPGPYELDIRFREALPTDQAMRVGAQRIDDRTLRYRSEDILEIIYS